MERIVSNGVENRFRSAPQELSEGLPEGEAEHNAASKGTGQKLFVFRRSSFVVVRRSSFFVVRRFDYLTKFDQK